MPAITITIMNILLFVFILLLGFFIIITIIIIIIIIIIINARGEVHVLAVAGPPRDALGRSMFSNNVNKYLFLIIVSNYVSNHVF